jgi:hypothetical protein
MQYCESNGAVDHAIVDNDIFLVHGKTIHAGSLDNKRAAEM